MCLPLPPMFVGGVVFCQGETYATGRQSERRQALQNSCAPVLRTIPKAFTPANQGQRLPEKRHEKGGEVDPEEETCWYATTNRPPQHRVLLIWTDTHDENCFIIGGEKVN